MGRLICRQARTAPAVEIDPLPHDLEPGLGGYLIAQPDDDVAAVVGVGNVSAPDADQINVRRDVAFVAGLLGEGQFLDQTALRKHAQGRINCGQRHGREVLLDALVDLLHRGMVGGVEHGLSDGQALRRDPHTSLTELLHNGALYHRPLPILRPSPSAKTAPAASYKASIAFTIFGGKPAAGTAGNFWCRMTHRNRT